MLEIALVWILSKKMGDVVQAKGHTRIGYQLMLVAFWIGGEIAGAVVGVVLQGGADAGEGGFPCMVYICALIGAASGAGIAFAIASSLANIKTDADFYRDDDYDRRRDDEIRRTWRTPQDRPRGDDYQGPPPERQPDDKYQE